MARNRPQGPAHLLPRLESVLRPLHRRQPAGEPRPAAEPRESWEATGQRLLSHADMLRRRLAAGWIVPVGSAPIERGAMLIAENGRIEVIGNDAGVPSPAGIPAEQFDDAIILPGLINTHTHLEL